MIDYSPRPGSIVEKAIAELQAREGQWVTGRELAGLVGLPNKQLWSRLESAMKHGAVERAMVDDAYSYRWVSPEDRGVEPEPKPFNASYWLDGELVLRGVQRLEDGAVLLKKDQVEQMLDWLVPLRRQVAIPQVSFPEWVDDKPLT